MKQTIKSFLEDLSGVEVVANKVSYNKNGFSRRYRILDADAEQYVHLPDQNISAELSLPEEVTLSWEGSEDSATLLIKVPYSYAADWKEFESSIDFPEQEEECACDEEEEEVHTSLDIEAIVSELKVGYNYVPGIGTGYCTDEKDLENLKHFVRGALTMFNMINL